MCDHGVGPNPEVTAASGVSGVDSLSAGPLVYQNLGNSTDPGAAFEYTNNGVQVMQDAFDPGPVRDTFRQIRALGNRAVFKGLFYALGDETAVTAIDPGSTADADLWCQNYYTNVLSSFIDADLPNGAEFDILNIETELNGVTHYAEPWLSLIQQVRSAGFRGIITSSANDPSITNTPWAAALDWFGYDCYPSLSNATYIGQNPFGNASDPAQLLAFFQSSVADTMINASRKFGGIPVYLGEFSLGSGPAANVNWTDTEWATLTGALFAALSPLDCWAGVNWWRWPYDNPDGTAAYLPGALLTGLSAGWQAFATAPEPSPLSQLGPRTPRPLQARTPTVLPRPSSEHLRSTRTLEA
jgi:hypothetical protein